jgi:hypothetical protein
MSKADKIQFIIKFLADNEFLGKDTKAIENYQSYYRRGLLTYHEAVSEIYKNMLYGEIKLFYENFCTTGNTANITEAYKTIKKYNAV